MFMKTHRRQYFQTLVIHVSVCYTHVDVIFTCILEFVKGLICLSFQAESLFPRNLILKSFGTDYKAIVSRLLITADLPGMILRKAKLLNKEPSQMRIVLKPNLISCTPAEFGATTHPEVVAALAETLHSSGFFDLTVMEGSWIGDQTTEAFEYCGYNALSREYGLRLVDMQHEPSFPCDCGGLELNICRCILDADFLINLPVLKGHCQTKVTCSLKNLKGLIPNSEKRRFHTMGLHKPIAHLNLGIRPDLILTDHICGDPDFEEGGHPLTRNCVMLSVDPVLTDAYGATLLGWQPEDVEYIPLAASIGVGTMDLSSAEIRVLEGEDHEFPPRTRSLVRVEYAAEAVDSCSACYGALMEALDRLDQDHLLDKLPCRIAIGQGYQGKSGLFGVGRCTAGFERNIPGCPPSPDKIYQTLIRWIAEESRLSTDSFPFLL